MRKWLSSAFMLLTFSGCSTALPVSSTVNDFVLMNTKVNGRDAVSLIYEAKHQDARLFPAGKDRTEIPQHPGYIYSQTETFGKMLREYISNRFTNVSDSGTVKIRVTLQDFWIEQYGTDSSGAQFVTVMFGGEMNLHCYARTSLNVSVEKDGQTFTKKIVATAEDNHISGYGTRTSTSNIHRGGDAIEHVHARNINNANNKALMLMNAFLEEVGI